MKSQKVIALVLAVMLVFGVGVCYSMTASDSWQLPSTDMPDKAFRPQN